ncbi:hypothetical protein CEXT_698341 [Caerostris extrusa]|uniref:Uncharacterized protein n=1 Tax=Caerostris extrusa TaxID=172846 RepID=A0AAV4NN97_CAEEX|nr:hypothetical protein CEXT_698341 [Caerostris extrusa]
MWSESTSMHVESHCVATKKELNFESEKDGSVFCSTFEDKNGETNSAEQNWNSDDEQNSNDSKIIDVNNIAIESCLQTSLDLELQLKDNKISLPQPYVILKSKDIVNCNKSKNIILSDEEFPKNLVISFQTNQCLKSLTEIFMVNLKLNFAQLLTITLLKLEPRSEKAASKNHGLQIMGDNQAQASRLVFPSNHEPEIPRWPMDPNQAWGMTQMLHPPLPPPPVPPF